MNHQPFVRVVVLNWNSFQLTSRCLRSLRATSYPENRLEILVVDNGSVDGSFEALISEFAEVVFVRNDRNLGFAEACNRGMRDLDDVDMVALVNNDAEVEPGWLQPLVQTLSSRPDAGAAAACLILSPTFSRFELSIGGLTAAISEVKVDGVEVGSRCLYEGMELLGDPDWPLQIEPLIRSSGAILAPASLTARMLSLQLVRIKSADSARIVATLSASGVTCSEVWEPGEENLQLTIEIPPDRVELLNGLGTGLTADLEGYDIGFGTVGTESLSAHEVLGFCGGGVLLRSVTLQDVGLFDPRFFAYYEDTDLSWRMRKSGWKTIAVPESRIHHSFGGSRGDAAEWFFFLNYRNWLLTVIRNGSAAEIGLALRKALDLTGRSIRGNLISRVRHGRPPSLRLTQAWMRVWLGLFASLPLVMAKRSARSRRTIGRYATERVRTSLVRLPD